MKNKVKISACIITYNHEHFLRKCLEGAVSQKLNCDYEIIVGVDKSTDNTLEVAEEFKNKYPQLIKLFVHKENLGMIGNWKDTIGKCSGDYIAICEGDDYWTDQLKLQTQVDFLETNKDYVVTYHNAKIVDENDKCISTSKLTPQWERDLSSDELKRAPFILTLTMCFRNVIKSFPDEFNTVLNADTFLISMLGRFGRGKYLNEINPAVYRAHSLGVWSLINQLDKKISSINTYRKIREYFNRIGDKETASYYSKLIDDTTISAVESAPLDKNFKKISKVFLSEYKISAYLWFISYKLSLRIFKSNNQFLRKKFIESF